LVRYYVGLAASIGVLMILQWMMYGNPFTSGHGSASQVFTTQFFWRNVLHHAKWFLIVHTPLIVLFLVAAWRWGSKPFARTACAIFLAVSAPYMFYGVPFDDWEMLRFLMPGFVFLIMASADGAEQLAVHFAPRVTRTLATLVVGVAALTASYLYLQHQHVFRLSYAESKYPAVAAWISANTPDDAVVLASLHSGSVRHYSGRLTLRWDRIPSDRLAATVRAISARGSRAFLVLDGDERAQFAKRFGERHLEVINRVRTVDTVDIARFAVE
jgi:hypothetical protein